MNPPIIVSLGGSVVVPDVPNTEFLKRFRKELSTFHGKAVFVIGGGRTARVYAKTVRDLHGSVIDQDMVGILSTQLNAELVARVLQAPLSKTISSAPFHKFLVSGGFSPGHSSDYDAVQFALHHGARTVYNITNVDYVYSKKPGTKGAKPLENLTWEQFRTLFGGKWVPGMNTPFDPRASALAEHHHLEVIFIGANVKNIINAFKEKPFKGTTVKN